MTDTHIDVFATGGTIAGTAGSATRRDYRPGQISVEDLLAEMAKLGLPARLVGRQFANIGSEDIGPELWRRLHEAAMESMADPACQGIMITHGTDTAEETAFLFDQTLPTAKPVVLVGAMRPADAVGSDGMRNFANAVRVAGDADAAGRGVLLVMSDHIFAARDARKARTEGTHAFRGFPRGPVGHVTPTSLEWFGPAWRVAEPARFAFHEHMPKVSILYAYAGMTADEVQQALDGGARGLVLAGFGQGNASAAIRAALAKAVLSGVPVVRSSRVDEGLVDHEPDDDTHGFIAARALGPPKARILLQLLLANGVTDPVSAQQAFDRR
ncbi:asparaginase [Altererythrobacter confluentis]|uniref:Asparaginase n=1 Tax=Allopontixanthobacter confluentis TaxID=1849021 RepID=A0A6L7GC15_9SPHN|nr:asparaginase [Allopontixanthobacter confluentis]MXP13523.1 asparaginase [Allopontixanthobacter confluentis]